MIHHTQGPLEVRGTRIFSPGPQFDCVASMQVSNQPNWDEDARRLVACWNALDGVPTEAIEGALIHGRALMGLAAERDQLLAALSCLVSHLDDGAYAGEKFPPDHPMHAARSAITKATRQAA